MCQKERDGVFTAFSGGTRHAHLCRSSAGPTPHDLVSYRTARTAFFEKLFYVFWGVFFGMLLWDLRLGGE